MELDGRSVVITTMIAQGGWERKARIVLKPEFEGVR
jgi:hypothetical protein